MPVSSGLELVPTSENDLAPSLAQHLAPLRSAWAAPWAAPWATPLARASSQWLLAWAPQRGALRCVAGAWAPWAGA